MDKKRILIAVAGLLLMMALPLLGGEGSQAQAGTAARVSVAPQTEGSSQVPERSLCTVSPAAPSLDPILSAIEQTTPPGCCTGAQRRACVDDCIIAGCEGGYVTCVSLSCQCGCYEPCTANNKPAERGLIGNAPLFSPKGRTSAVRPPSRIE